MAYYSKHFIFLQDNNMQKLMFGIANRSLSQ